MWGGRGSQQKGLLSVTSRNDDVFWMVEAAAFESSRSSGGRFGWSVHFGWLVGRSVDAEQLANEAHEARRSGVVVSLFRFDRLKSELIREPPSNNQKLICCFLFFLLLFRNPPGESFWFLTPSRVFGIV